MALFSSLAKRFKQLLHLISRSLLERRPATEVACGKAVACNDLPDFRFLVDCGAALAADMEDPASFADALRRLATDADLRARLGAAGLRFAAEHGSWDASIARIDRLLGEVAGR